MGNYHFVLPDVGTVTGITLPPPIRTGRFALIDRPACGRDFTLRIEPDDLYSGLRSSLALDWKTVPASTITILCSFFAERGSAFGLVTAAKESPLTVLMTA